MRTGEEAGARDGLRATVRWEVVRPTSGGGSRGHEEFYEVTDAEPELGALQAGLREWETTYNHVRPHQALGYLTPADFLRSVGVQV